MKRERWLPVVGYEGYYEVSDHGRVRSVERIVDGYRGKNTHLVRSRIMKPGRHQKGGHLLVYLSKLGKVKGFGVHTLVLTAFIGPCPPGLNCCRHFPDRNPENNHLDNLQWGTWKENSRDMDAHRTRCIGAANPSARLTEKQVREIRTSTLTQTHLAKKYGVAQTTISAVRRGETWAHVC
jgi:hypothetical protein